MSVGESRPEDQRIDMGALLGSIAGRWLRIVLVLAIALGATYAVLLFVPKLYESSASLLVEDRTNPFTRSSNDTGTGSSGISMDALLSSQIELIRSRDTLRAVAEQLRLGEVREFSGAGFSPVDLVMQLLGRPREVKSGEETVIENLSERITVIRARDSAVITVFVRSADPQLAADIANAIANTHVQRRAALSISDTAEASDWLEQEIAKLRTRVVEAETAVANYRAENDLYQGANNVSVRDQQLSVIATQITSAQERKNSARSRANLIRGLLDSGQPIDGVADVRNSLVIQNLVQSKAALQGELAQRSSTLLPNHPTIKALRAQIDSIESQIAREGRSVAEALEAEAQVEANLEQSLNDDLARMKLSVSTASRDTVTLDSLQREAKAQRDLLESYLARYSDAASRTDAGSTLPDVRVVSFATASGSPASPKTPLVLGAVAFVVLALQVGGILFGELMSGRAIVAPSGTAAVSSEAEPDLMDESEPDHEIEPTPVAPPHPFAEAATRHVEPPAAHAVDEETDADRRFDDAPPVGETLSISVPEATEAEPNPEPSPTVVSEPPKPRAPASPGAAALELSNLAADIAIGRVRVVMLAALDNYRDVEAVADSLARSAVNRGLSVASIDAGSGRPSVEPGLTDLAADRASFGDVVHKVSEGLAAVPWGHQEGLERRSMKPATLIEALTDIYEVVIVRTGRIGVTSALPVFSGLDCRLVLVAGDRADPDLVHATLGEAATLGYEVGQMVWAPSQRSVA